MRALKAVASSSVVGIESLAAPDLGGRPRATDRTPAGRRLRPLDAVAFSPSGTASAWPRDAGRTRRVRRFQVRPGACNEESPNPSPAGARRRVDINGRALAAMRPGPISSAPRAATWSTTMPCCRRSPPDASRGWASTCSGVNWRCIPVTARVPKCSSWPTSAARRRKRAPRWAGSSWRLCGTTCRRVGQMEQDDDGSRPLPAVRERRRLEFVYGRHADRHRIVSVGARKATGSNVSPSGSVDVDAMPCPI